MIDTTSPGNYPSDRRFSRYTAIAIRRDWRQPYWVVSVRQYTTRAGACLVQPISPAVCNVLREESSCRSDVILWLDNDIENSNPEGS